MLENILDDINRNLFHIDAVEKITNGYTENDLKADPKLIKKWIIALKNSGQEEQFWNAVIPIMTEDSFSEDSLDYFLSHKVGCISLAHKNLPDKWLKKLIVFDDAALYRLAVRYYTDESIPGSKFIEAAQKYIINSLNLFSYLNELYPSTKQRMLLYLGRQSSDNSVSAYAAGYLEALRLRYVDESEELQRAYQKAGDNDEILLALAENIFTPRSILQDLGRAAKIKNASKIRIAANETIRLLKMINPQ